MADNRPAQNHPLVGDFNNPHGFLANRNAIRPNSPPRQEFTIPHQLIAMVRQNQFHGLASEHPMDHVDSFEDICSTIRLNGVSNDYLYCTLFTHSLADKALRWLKSLPANSIQTWDECRSKFLSHFYTTNRTNSLRNMISQFQQSPVESFYESWERFKEYLRDCPHHGFSELNLLNIFYSGVDHQYRLSLDTASNGNFMTKSVGDAYQLIENLAASNRYHCPDYDRRMKVTTSDNSEISELKGQVSELKGEVSEMKGLLTQLLKNQNQKHVSFAESAEATCFAFQDQVYQPQHQSFVQNSNSGGFQTTFQPGFQQAPLPQVQQENKMELMLKQILESQQQSQRSLNVKLDNMYNDLNNKFESLSTHVKHLDTQVAQTSEAVKRQVGVLPGKFEDNPMGYCKSITSVLVAKDDESAENAGLKKSGKDAEEEIDRSHVTEKIRECRSIDPTWIDRSIGPKLEKSRDRSIPSRIDRSPYPDCNISCSSL